MISDIRINQMIQLLEAMGKGSKMPSDGLGLYLGDGLSRKGLGELRTNELLEALKELRNLRIQGRMGDLDGPMIALFRD